MYTTILFLIPLISLLIVGSMWLKLKISFFNMYDMFTYTLLIVQISHSNNTDTQVCVLSSTWIAFVNLQLIDTIDICRRRHFS